MTVTTYWKDLLSLLFMGFIVAFFIFYPIRWIYVWSTTIKILFHGIYNTTKNTIKDEVIFYRCFFLIQFDI